ncbi:MAG: glycosyltransferase family 4 protein [Acidimicrobiales bacterium]
MKVALVHNFHSGRFPSGEDEAVRAEADALTRAGIDVRVLGFHSGDRLLSTAQAAVTIMTGVGRSPLRELSAFGPDVIHVHNLFPSVDRRWMHRIQVPIVVTAHSYRPMCANGYLYRDGEVCTLCVDGGRPWPAVRYGCYRGRVGSLPYAIGNRGGATKDPLLSAARQVLVLSERARSVFEQAGVPHSKLRLDAHFVPDALDPGLGREPRSAWVFVGRLTPEKGIEQLVAEWPVDEPLRILGDGELRPALEQAARGKPIEFLGKRPRADVMAEIRTAFGLVVPSRWYETFGLVYIEALAAGVPTMAFRPNVVADAVLREGTGAVAAWGELAGALASARVTFADLRDHCRSVFEARYTEDVFVDRRLAVYKELSE